MLKVVGFIVVGWFCFFCLFVRFLGVLCFSWLSNCGFDYLVQFLRPSDRLQ